MKAFANLRISYLGGGYDYPEFFKDTPVEILSEGLPLSVTYQEAGGKSPVSDFSGLGSSAARHLSFLRYYFAGVDFKELVNVAIRMDGFQKGGWQDAIASAYEGFIKIRLYDREWSVDRIETDLQKYRRLYKIPVIKEQKGILGEMVCRESSFETMQVLVREAEKTLRDGDFHAFGASVVAGWVLKKRWHPAIANPVIEEMEHCAGDAGAWGWKVCGAGGQGYFLVIGDGACHSQMSEKYEVLVIQRRKNEKI